MAQTGYTPIQLYHSTTAAAAPTAGNLANGELALNITDGKLYYKDNGGNVQLLASKAGAAGDVVGPASATDNALVRFDATTGKLVQNSVGVLDDSGNLTGIAALTTSGALTLNGGTANGVAYLNASKVLTTGSALTFDGTNWKLGNPTTVSGYKAQIYGDLLLSSGAFGAGQTYTLSLGDGNAFMQSENGQPVAFGSYNGFKWGFASSDNKTINTEWMRLTSTGLGIGTSSPTNKLQVSASSDDGIRISAFSDASLIFSETTANKNWKLKPSAGDLYWQYSSTAYNSGYSALMTLTSTGNLGLGVTPSAWEASRKALQIGSGVSLWGRTSSTSADQAFLGANVFSGSGGLTFLQNGRASMYEQGGGAHYWYTTGSSGTAGNAISFTQAMALTAAGMLGLGTTTPNKDGGSAIALTINSSSGGRLELANADTREAQFFASNLIAVLTSYNDKPFAFEVNGTERARITSGGYFKASNSGSYDNSTGAYHELDSDQNNHAVYIKASNASLSTTGVLQFGISRNTTNNSFYAISYYNSGASAYKFRVADSGDVTNTNGTYGTISDAKMKTDIVDAGSQWADIKAIRFRKFKIKNDPSGVLQLGVVAQELEQTSPGLVDEHTDRDAEGNDLGTTTKSVKTSVLLMKAAVALQEAMARIEQLEAKVAALEAA